ncbi:MAG: M48 family metalloprotease [Acidobacteriota bacterium]
MNAIWLTCVVASAAVALSNAFLGLTAWSAWPLVRRLAGGAKAEVRARVFFAWRIVPAAAPLAAGTIVGLAFVAFEPPNASESAGLTLLAPAALGALLLAGGMARASGALVASARLARAWETDGRSVAVPGVEMAVRVVDDDFPVAAVVGWCRPRLVVARAVMERCSSEELAAIAAHEQGHVRARDNLRRLALTAAADTLWWTRRGSDMIAAWQDAAEEAADDHAAASGACDVELAGALVAVSRLAAMRAPATWSAGVLFYRGAGIEHRVRRLLERSHPDVVTTPKSSSWPLLAMSAALTAVMLVVTTDSGRTVYAATEWLVQRMP